MYDTLAEPGKVLGVVEEGQEVGPAKLTKFRSGVGVEYGYGTIKMHVKIQSGTHEGNVKSNEILPRYKRSKIGNQTGKKVEWKRQKF